MRRTACPVHTSSVTAFASALAANICVAADATLAFCFTRDVETEQLLGVYSARGLRSPTLRPSPAGRRHDNQGDCSRAVSIESPQLGNPVSRPTMMKRNFDETATLQSRFKSLKIESCGSLILGRSSTTKSFKPSAPKYLPGSSAGRSTGSLGGGGSALLALTERCDDDFLFGPFASCGCLSGKEPFSGDQLRGGLFIESLSPDASALFSSVLAQDAVASNSCVPGEAKNAAEDVPAAARSMSLKAPGSKLPPPSDASAKASSARLAEPPPERGKDKEEPGGPRSSMDAGAPSMPPFYAPEFIAVSSDSFVGLLMNNLTNGAQVGPSSRIRLLCSHRSDRSSLAQNEQQHHEWISGRGEYGLPSRVRRIDVVV